MKTVTLALVVTLAVNLSAAEIKPGDTFNEVKATMGPARGQLRLGDRLLLYYDRGEVELQAGVVSRVALMSLDDHAALETKRAAIATRIREEQAVRRAQVSAEGEKLMARKLADATFLAAPLSYQVAFWEDFSRRYPEVPSAEPLTIARLRYAEQLESKRAQTEQEERLAELEIRAREIEATAALAEARSRRIRQYRYADGASYQPFTLWPVEYRYFDVIHSPAASPGVFSQPPSYRRDDASSGINYDRSQRNNRFNREDNDLGKCGSQTGHARSRADGRFRM